MKYIVSIFSFLLLVNYGTAQNVPKAADPCQKLDTNNLKQLILGTWIDMNDTSHTIYFSEDSLVERIKVVMDGKSKSDISYWGYKFIDNIFSTDAVTCFSLREFKECYSHHTDVAINSIDAHYLLMGSAGKTAFKKK